MNVQLEKSHQQKTDAYLLECRLEKDHSHYIQIRQLRKQSCHNSHLTLYWRIVLFLNTYRQYMHFRRDNHFFANRLHSALYRREQHMFLLWKRTSTCSVVCKESEVK
jgi:hypothetical protein